MFSLFWLQRSRRERRLLSPTSQNFDFDLRHTTAVHHCHHHHLPFLHQEVTGNYFFLISPQRQKYGGNFPFQIQISFLIPFSHLSTQFSIGWLRTRVYCLFNCIGTGLLRDDADGSDNFGPCASSGSASPSFGISCGRIPANGSEIEERNPNADPERYYFCCQSCFESRPY